MRNGVFPWAALVLVGALLGSGCSSDGDGGSNLESALISKLRSCGLLSEGPFSIPTDEADACFIECLTDADCDELNDALCAPWARDSGALQRCEAQCAFTCNDGTIVDMWDVCDGVEDCPDGEDEAGCATFVCNDGSEIPTYYVCDGWADCPDGEDEEGCATFVCDDGSEIPADWQCDGYEDCDDGEDEAGCAEFTLMCEPLD